MSTYEEKLMYGDEAQSSDEQWYRRMEALAANNSGIRKAYQAARARGLSPTGVLGAVLACLDSQLPPHVMADYRGTSYSSMNFNVALVADSGGGKSSCIDLAKTLIRDDKNAYRADVKSGEAFETLFAKNVSVVEDIDGKKVTSWNLELVNPCALIVWDEVSTLTSMMRRQGNTIEGISNTTFTAGVLGGGRVSEEASRTIPSHGYRLCQIMGVQPKLSEEITSKEDSGYGQRILFFDAEHDPLREVWKEQEEHGMPELPIVNPDLIPKVPETLALIYKNGDMNRWKADGGKYDLLISRLPQRAIDEQNERNDERLLGSLNGSDMDDENPLDAQKDALLAKLCCLLPWLDDKRTTKYEKTHPTQQDWEDAKTIYEYSQHVRDWMINRANAYKIAKSAKRARDHAQAQTQAEQDMEEIREKTRTRILDFLRKRHVPQSGKDIRNGVTQESREYVYAELKHLEHAEKIVLVENKNTKSSNVWQIVE